MVRRHSPSIGQLNEAKRQAAILRAEWLLNIQAGVLQPADAIASAIRHDEAALRKLTLHQLLLSEAGVGAATAATKIDLLIELAGTDADGLTRRELTIGWLVDSRVSGRRLALWAEVVAHLPASPWEGFPFTTPPTELRIRNDACL